MRKCGGDLANGDIADCPFVRAHIAGLNKKKEFPFKYRLIHIFVFVSKVENVPSYLGGKCECDGGCIPGTPNKHPTSSMRKITPEEVKFISDRLEETRRKDKIDLEKLGVKLDKK